MPITYQSPSNPIQQDAFKRIDYEVMGSAFEVHNELGNLFDESVYKTYLIEKLRAKGIRALSEFQIQITHENYSKDYYVDLMVNESVPYELKTTNSLDSAHEAQLLNYLLLSNLQHGKLVNFRTPSVEGRFVSSTLRAEDRKRYTLDTSNWREHTERPVLTALRSLLDDWGTHLSIHLYQEALLHLLRPSQFAPQRTTLTANTHNLGSTQLPLLSPHCMLYITGINNGFTHHEKHLQRLLKLSPVQIIQWINFNQSSIHLQSIR